ncbi:MAG: Hsp20/alpha crystallin family protein [Candidatus Hodarchaeota archaeon]
MMSDIKEEKKVDVKTDEKEDIKEEPTEKKGEIQVRSRYRPLSIFRDIDRFFDDMDKFFVDFWRPSRFWNFEPFGLSLLDDNIFRTPLSNIVDEGDHFTITAELPGLEKGDIEISVRNGALEIKGEQKNEIEDKKEGYLRREYSSSSYYRSFKLPENINEDKIEAKLEKGVLKLSLPKIEEEKKEKKKIEVK